MFLRKFYLNFIKTLNSKLLLKYFNINIYTFDRLVLSRIDVRQLDFFKKTYLCVFPNFYSTNYTILNANTLRLMRFRKKFLPNLSLKVETYISHDYNVLNDNFYSVYFDFLNEFVCKDFIFLKKLFKSNNSYFSLYLMFFFLEKHFYRYFSLNFFKNFNFDFNQLTKINFFFTKIFIKINLFKNKLSIINIEKYTNWFKFITLMNSKNMFLLESYEPKIDDIFTDTFTKNSLDDFKKEIISILNDDIKPYVVLYSAACRTYFNKITYRLIRTVFNVNIDLNKLFNVSIDSKFLEKVNNLIPYRYSESSLNKFINMSKIDNFILFYLRKTKIFNKGRYSRNRQTYRTGFYWCLWLNIFVVYGLHFVFYRFTFTFGYLWAFLFIFFGSFVFSRALKYNFISYNSVVNEVKEFTIFSKFIISYFFNLLKNLFFNFIVFFRRLIDTTTVYSYTPIDLDVYNSYINYKDTDWVVKLYNDLEDYIYDIFKRESKFDLDVVFKENFNRSENVKTLSELLIDTMFLTDAHDITSDMFEERMLTLQRRLIEREKLKRGEDVCDMSEEAIWKLKYGKI